MSEIIWFGNERSAKHQGEQQKLQKKITVQTTGHINYSSYLTFL